MCRQQNKTPYCRVVNFSKTKIVLIGLGPHSKRIYYPFIEKATKTGGKFSILVELESKKQDVFEYLKNKEIKPQEIIFIPDSEQVTPKKIDSGLKIKLDKYIKKFEITHAVIATEPKAHKIYLDYFICNQIPCLVDKPITSPIGLSYNKESSNVLMQETKELLEKSYTYNTPIYVQVQRREHPAYIYLFNSLKKVIEDYEVPITYFNIYHSDGTWSMPSEYFTRENHPYKYGYGKLMHSGYHFVDIVSWIINTNKVLYDSILAETKTKFLLPSEHYRQINGKKLYKKIFDKTTQNFAESKLGEIDAYIDFSLFGVKNRKKNIITNGHLDLLQSGFSKRQSFEIAKDTYKGNGRVRHEFININIGPLLNAQLHSYQSEQLTKGNLFGVGGEEHLDLYLFRNNKIIGGKPLEIIDFGKLINRQNNKSEVYFGQNEQSRYEIFKKFINKEQSDVIIEKQMTTNQLLSSIYKSFLKKEGVLTKIK